MRVLIYHDRTGLVGRAFRKTEHYVSDCEDNVFLLLDKYTWDLLIAFPSCTYLCNVGSQWMLPKHHDRFPHRVEQRRVAIDVFMRLIKAPVKRICVENPLGIMSREYRRPDQYVQPYFFGEPYSKKTCLWLKNLPLLRPTNQVEPSRSVNKIWLGLDPESKNRARAQIAIKGMHLAMAEQWGELE